MGKISGWIKRYIKNIKELIGEVTLKGEMIQHKEKMRSFQIQLNKNTKELNQATWRLI